MLLRNYGIQGYFRPMLLSPFYTYKRLCPVFNSPRWNFVKNHIICTSGIRPVLNSPSDIEGGRDKNKTEANIYLYTVYLLRRHELCLVRHCIKLQSKVTQFKQRYKKSSKNYNSFLITHFLRWVVRFTLTIRSITISFIINEIILRKLFD